jgi:O-antigen/teichoic acid export membrane protein
VGRPLAATQVVFARLYGKPIYGAYLSALAVLEIWARGGNGGADKAMLRYVPAAHALHDDAAVRSAIGTGLRLSFAVAGTFALVILLGAPWAAGALDQAALGPVLRTLAPLPLLAGAVGVLIQASLAARTTRANFYVRGLAEPTLLLGAGVVAWLLGAGVRGLAAAHVTAAALTFALTVWVVRRALRPGETTRLLRAPRRAGLARFSLPYAAAEMLNAVVQRADIVILARLKGVEAAALYGATELVTRAIANIRYAFDSIVAGVLSETLHLGEMPRLRYNLRLTTRWVISIAAPIAVTIVVLRRELLGLLFGASYAAGAAAVLALSASHFVNAALGLAGWVLVVAGYSRISFVNNLICAAFNIPAGFLLIRRFGLAGAGCAALATSVLCQTLIVAEVAVLKKVHPFSAALLKPIVAAVATALAESALRTTVTAAWLRVLLVIAAGAATYAAALVTLGLPEEERRILSRLFKKT